MSVNRIIDLMNQGSFGLMREAIQTFIPTASKAESVQLREYFLKIANQPISTHDDYSQVSEAINVLAYFHDGDIEEHLLKLLHDKSRRSPVISCLCEIQENNPTSLNFSRIVDTLINILSEVPVDNSDHVALEKVIPCLWSSAVTQETAAKALSAIVPFLDAPHQSLIRDAIIVVVNLSKRLGDETWLSRIETFLNHKDIKTSWQAATSLRINYPDRYGYINLNDYLISSKLNNQ